MTPEIDAKLVKLLQDIQKAFIEGPDTNDRMQLAIRIAVFLYEEYGIKST